MAISLGDRRIWGLLAIVVLTTASILALRMLGLYEGFGAPEASVVPAHVESKKDTAEKDTAEKDTVEKDTVEKDTAEKDKKAAPSPLPAAAKGALR